MERKDLTERIDNSPYFSLDPGSAPTLREKEKNRLVEAVLAYSFQYVKYCQNYATETWETVLNCLKYYDSGKGQPFMHYYLSALHKNYRVWSGKEYYDGVGHGLKINQKKLSKVRKLIREEESNRDGNIKSSDFISMVEVIVELSSKEAEKYIQLASEGVQELNAAVGNGDTLTEYMEFQSDPRAEEELLAVEGDGYEAAFERIRQVFDGLRKRQKTLISMILTSKFYNYEEYHEVIKRYSFYNAEIFALCTERGASITDREIAKMTEQFETAVCRSWKGFIRKLKERRTE